MRNGIRAAGLNYDQASCDINDSGQPTPRCGNFYVSIHDGMSRSDADNQLNEWYDFAVTLTMRVTVSLDQVATAQMSRNISRVPLGERQGFYAKADRLRAFLHMNWTITVLQGQTPASANDNLAAWSTGTVYGFVEPMRFQSMENPKLVGGEWFAAEPDAEDMGIKATLQFGRCRRFQPVLAASGPFV